MDLCSALGAGSLGFSGVGLALPLGSGSFRTRYAKEHGKRYKKLTEWAWQLLLLVRRWHPERQVVAVADRTYASLKLLDRCRRLRNPITFITRLRLDAALYEPAPPRRPGQMGRSRLKGERLSNLSVVAEDPDIVWTPITVVNWYGNAQRMVEIVSNTAVWYSSGLPAVPLRWVLIRDPQGEFETQALLCTDLQLTPERIITYFVRRWQMEATFQEVRQSGWDSRQGGIGRRRRFEGPPRRSWPCSPWLRSSPISRRRECHRLYGEQRGTRRNIRPSPMPWRWCVRSCGPRSR